MNNNYCLSGTKIVIRRLFKQDTADILSCYEEYNTLFHNPVSAEYLENIFLCGEIWGAYLGGSIIGCCYYFPMDSGFFRNTAFGSALADFTDCTGKYYFMGYMGIKQAMAATAAICQPKAGCIRHFQTWHRCRHSDGGLNTLCTPALLKKAAVPKRCFAADIR